MACVCDEAVGGYDDGVCVCDDSGRVRVDGDGVCDDGVGRDDDGICACDDQCCGSGFGLCCIHIILPDRDRHPGHADPDYGSRVCDDFSV